MSISFAIKTQSPFLNRAGIRDKDRIVELMADDLRVAAASSSCVTEDDFALLGWTPEQLATHGRAAKLRAQRLSDRRSNARR